MHQLYFFALAEASMMGGNAIQFHPLYMKGEFSRSSYMASDMEAV